MSKSSGGSSSSASSSGGNTGTGSSIFGYRTSAPTTTTDPSVRSNSQPDPYQFNNASRDPYTVTGTQDKQMDYRSAMDALGQASNRDLAAQIGITQGAKNPISELKPIQNDGRAAFGAPTNSLTDITGRNYSDLAIDRRDDRRRSEDFERSLVSKDRDKYNQQQLTNQNQAFQGVQSEADRQARQRVAETQAGAQIASSMFGSFGGGFRGGYW